MPTAKDRTTSPRTPKSGIYRIRHVASGKVYIGRAVDFQRRWRVHRNDLRRKEHHSPHLQRAWDKHGPDAFAWEVVEFVEHPGGRDALIAALLVKEQEWLDRLQPWRRAKGFNLSPTAGSNLGLSVKPETRAKLSATHKARGSRVDFTPEVREAHKEGCRRRSENPEYRAKLSRANKGKPPSPQAMAKAIETRKGKPSHNRGVSPSEETRARISATLKGRPLDPERREKLRENNLGRRLSDEHRAAISAALRGNQHSKGRDCTPETRAKWAENARGNQYHKGKPHSPETRAKISETKRRRNAEKQAAKRAVEADHQRAFHFLE